MNAKQSKRRSANLKLTEEALDKWCATLREHVLDMCELVLEQIHPLSQSELDSIGEKTGSRYSFGCLFETTDDDSAALLAEQLASSKPYLDAEDVKVYVKSSVVEFHRGDLSAILFQIVISDTVVAHVSDTYKTEHFVKVA